jgi:DNA-binding response OmpR family regulator
LSRGNLKLLFGEGVQFNANKLQAGGGSGFGLFITKGIVMLHKGANIWAESEGEGQGCTFFVELPMVSVAASTSADEESENDDYSDSDDSDGSMSLSEAPQSQHSKASKPDLAIRNKSTNSSVVQAVFKPRVLIVDDSAMSRRMLARMLEAEGFECVHAVDGLAAVAYVSRADMLYRRSDSEMDNAKSATIARHELEADPRTPALMSRGPSRHARGLLSAYVSRQPSANGVRFSPIETPRRHESPDIVLMDSNMPKMNGPDATIEIRKMGYTFPIFGVTGDEDHAVFMRAGADGVMMKPVRAAELVKTIHTALRKSMSEEAVKLPAVCGSLSPRASDFAGRYVSDEYATKMEAWLAAHAPVSGASRKLTSRVPSQVA